MERAERLMKLLELLRSRPGMDAEALAEACGASTRTLQRDLDALGDSGFPVYFDRGYRLAAPALLPAITLSVDQALALRVAAQSLMPQEEEPTFKALSVAIKKLEQALTAQPPEDGPRRQLALALPIDDPRAEAVAAVLIAAIAEQRTVRALVGSGSGREGTSKRYDPYQLLPTPHGRELLAYCHDRRRLIRLPIARLQEVVALQRRFRPVPARLLERHLHSAQAPDAELRWVRLLARPPMAQALRQHPPVGTLMWERGAEGTVIFVVGSRRPEDLIPWLLSCGAGVEVLEPPDLRRGVQRVAQSVVDRYSSC